MKCFISYTYMVLKYALSPSESEGEPGVFHCPFSAVMLHTGKFPP